MGRIGFFCGLPFHRAILEPIRDAIAGSETLMSADRTPLVRSAPDVLVLADLADLEFFRTRLPGTWIGSVRHGLIGKRGLARLPDRPIARQVDFLAVGAGFRAEAYAAAGATPTVFWLTGYPQLDPLFRRDPPIDLGLDRSRPTVLYAPTWNLGLSSAEMLGPGLVRLVRGVRSDVNVVIKPHPMTLLRRPRWMRWWREMARREEGVRLVEDPATDVTRLMLGADLLLSDASSTIFEFLALDRPIVLLSNPRARNDPAFDGEDVVWRWRDVGPELTDVAGLPGAVADSLAEPDRYAATRAAYAQQLFGDQRDGLNHRRVAERLMDLVRRGSRPPEAGLEARSGGVRSGLAGWRREQRLRLGRSALASRTVFAWAESARLTVRAARG